MILELGWINYGRKTHTHDESALVSVLFPWNWVFVLTMDIPQTDERSLIVPIPLREGATVEDTRNELEHNGKSK